MATSSAYGVCCFGADIPRRNPDEEVNQYVQHNGSPWPDLHAYQGFNTVVDMHNMHSMKGLLVSCFRRLACILCSLRPAIVMSVIPVLNYNLNLKVLKILLRRVLGRGWSFWAEVRQRMTY